ncbi:hypothetical protein CLV84_0188 [Neolewinella xylanilytica]|uniref:Uncharacterized protein n=1 Tax=Neolewinella xylanilytica TaxID=1514080 RepID=A0A2S6I6Y4_9BACT|nr:hypothetical protein [Neolewinella xylanilytica]PPK87251.1 hypothetical protein CLV84_0188 [Neolewinella xylanilytica]
MLRFPVLLFLFWCLALRTCSDRENSGATADPDTSSSASDFQLIVLTDFICGDNCYLRYAPREGGTGTSEAICRAPARGERELLGNLPDSLRGRRALASFSTGIQVNGSGTVVRRDFPSIVALQLLPPSNRLPLRPGFYLIADLGCSDPANAAFRVWTGRGLSGSATRDCDLSVISSKGNAYRVGQSCTDSYNSSRIVTELTLTIPDSTTLILAEEGAGIRFERCPAGEVPDWARIAFTLSDYGRAAKGGYKAPNLYRNTPDKFGRIRCR